MQAQPSKHRAGVQGLGMLGRLSGLEELAVNSDDVDRRMAFAMIGKRLTQLPPSWANFTQARSMETLRRTLHEPQTGSRQQKHPPCAVAELPVRW